MSISYRIADKEDLSFLKEMLYQALYVPPGGEAFPRTLIERPEISKYLDDWGKEGDFAVLAENKGEPMGAAWYRCFGEDNPGYGYISSDIPELTIAVDSVGRGTGVGEGLMKYLFKQAKIDGFQGLSLSVDARNYAFAWYKRLGFESVGVEGHTHTMVLRFKLGDD